MATQAAARQLGGAPVPTPRALAVTTLTMVGVLGSASGLSEATDWALARVAPLVPWAENSSEDPVVQDTTQEPPPGEAPQAGAAEGTLAPLSNLAQSMAAGNQVTLTAQDLPKAAFQGFDASAQLEGSTAVVNVSTMTGGSGTNLSNWVLELKQLAQSAGANVLRVRGVFGNARLQAVLNGRYGLQQDVEKGVQYFEIKL